MTYYRRPRHHPTGLEMIGCAPFLIWLVFMALAVWVTVDISISFWVKP